MEGWGPVFANAGISAALAVFVYGRLTERVKAQGDDIADIGREQTSQRTTLFNHEGRISHLEGKRNAHG